ncbi:Acetyl esterase/lipase [Lutibacter oricola]|uniref:Acetyl esterase/lipase n=1 Tax=Lutibacter oricola TaxID=762486 RepID=A0A1H2WA30_9FLAO|nr:alpha/beta hydrolase [Lutibacter oricola]SDW77336.1 Acetyl esterase/lipase [Lutibacter oricola]
MMKYTLNIINKILILSFFIVVSYSCSSSDDSVIIDKTTAKELLNVSYGNETKQVFDVYLPANRDESTTKTFVLVHGGSWVSGDKNDLNDIVAKLKETYPNYAIVNVNYRLAGIGKSPFPMQIDDLESVFTKLKTKANEYQISSNFGFIGISAGAHLSMLYSYKYDTDKNVKMVCSIVGPTNFTDVNYTENPDYLEISQGIQLVTGVNYETNPTYYKNISPYHVVTSSAPPSILFYGGMDNLVPTTQGVEMQAKLDELGVTNQFKLYENEGHGWEGDALNDTYTKLENFINTHF